MYGMVNEGIKTFIVKTHGEETWQKICQDVSPGLTDFERMTSYDDRVTYDLVGAISAHTGLDAHEILKHFGTYWVEFAGNSNFGNLMRLSGNTLVERLAGLDDMHERILLSMPHLRPPSFELDRIDEDVYHLRYYSERDGLAPMVVGLVYGLAQETGEEIEVAHLTAKSAASDHDVFEITFVR